MLRMCYACIQTLRMLMRWDRCAKLPRGGGHHRKAGSVRSCRMKGCLLDCPWFHTPSSRASCFRTRYLCYSCFVCVARAYLDWERFACSPRLCIWNQQGWMNRAMRRSFRTRRWIFPAIEIPVMKRRRPQMHQSAPAVPKIKVSGVRVEESQTLTSWYLIQIWWYKSGVINTRWNEARLMLELIVLLEWSFCPKNIRDFGNALHSKIEYYSTVSAPYPNTDLYMGSVYRCCLLRFCVPWFFRIQKVWFPFDQGTVRRAR